MSIRLTLECVIVASIGYAIWAALDRSQAAVLGAIVTSGGIALAWIFCKPADESPSMFPARIRIPGRTRLVLEIAISLVAVFGLWTTVSRAAGETLLTAICLYYAVTWERVRLLVSGRSPG